MFHNEHTDKFGNTVQKRTRMKANAIATPEKSCKDAIRNGRWDKAPHIWVPLNKEVELLPLVEDIDVQIHIVVDQDVHAEEMHLLVSDRSIIVRQSAGINASFFSTG